VETECLRQFLAVWNRPLVYALRFGIHFSVNLVTFSYCVPISCTVYVWEPTWYARTIRQAHRDSLSFSLNLDPKKVVATSERSSTCSDLRTQLQCLTEAKAHGALPPHPPSNLDRMNKNARNLNTKFKLSEKN
jgi:hypothetical protein